MTVQRPLSLREPEARPRVVVVCFSSAMHWNIITGKWVCFILWGMNNNCMKHNTTHDQNKNTRLTTLFKFRSEKVGSLGSEKVGSEKVGSPNGNTHFSWRIHIWQWKVWSTVFRFCFCFVLFSWKKKCDNFDFYALDNHLSEVKNSKK